MILHHFVHNGSLSGDLPVSRATQREDASFCGPAYLTAATAVGARSGTSIHSWSWP